MATKLAVPADWKGLSPSDPILVHLRIFSTELLTMDYGLVLTTLFASICRLANLLATSGAVSGITRCILHLL